MPSKVTYDWRGDALFQRLRKAAAAAVEETVREAAAEALTSHEWVNRTGQLEEEIKVERANRSILRPSFRFGTTQRRGFYGYFHEEGTVHEFARPFLRPAADIHFPSLLSKILKRFAQ